MSDVDDSEHLKQAFGELRQLRDELRVQLHLAKAEARDEWHALEAQWRSVEARLTAFGRDPKQTGKVAATALLAVGDEIKQGYGRVKKSLRPEAS